MIPSSVSQLVGRDLKVAHTLESVVYIYRENDADLFCRTHFILISLSDVM